MIKPNDAQDAGTPLTAQTILANLDGAARTLELVLQQQLPEDGVITLEIVLGKLNEAVEAFIQASRRLSIDVSNAAIRVDNKIVVHNEAPGAHDGIAAKVEEIMKTAETGANWQKATITLTDAPASDTLPEISANISVLLQSIRNYLKNIQGKFPVSIANGGTGATSVEGVREALGLGATTGALPVANGGTGATTLAGIVKGNGTGAFSAAVAGTDYVKPNGDITGSASKWDKAAKTVSASAPSGGADGDIHIQYL